MSQCGEEEKQQKAAEFNLTTEKKVKASLILLFVVFPPL